MGKLKENNNVLDLACGPCQIGKYIKEKISVNITGVDLSREMLKIAKNNILDGVFIEDSIITFLNKEQVEKCIKNSISLLKVKGYMYVSFMDGNKEGFEKRHSGEIINIIYFIMNKERIRKVLTENGIHIEKEYILDYKKLDGRITKDVIYIGLRNE